MLKRQLTYPADAARFYQAIRHMSWAMWLDSGVLSERAAGYDILVADPVYRVICHGEITETIGPEGKVHQSTDELMSILRQLLGEAADADHPLLFTGGAVGYFSYDYGRRLQGLSEAGTNIDLPEAALGIYDWAVVLDHQRRQAWLTGRSSDSRSSGYWQSLEHSLNGAVSPVRTESPAGFVGQPESNMSHEKYAEAFQRIRRYLIEGDCYQVNLAQRFTLGFNGDPWQLYLRMRQQNPAPYGAYLDLPFGKILSSSPEQFVGLTEGSAVTRPIKGTRPRGSTEAEDAYLATELQNSEKDRAENLMIVDLLRNDLGRVCEPGSIQVPELFRVETYPTVHHLVSTISGRLRKEEDALSLLAACFPGGSITGAPKHRAMQIIHELEPDSREVYCGSIGWIGFNGNMNTNIAIRTLLIRDQQASYWAGGGIVADSVEADEFEETLHKAAAFFRLVRGTRDEVNAS